MSDESADNILIATRMGRLPTAAEYAVDPESAQYLLMTEGLRTLAEALNCLEHVLGVWELKGSLDSGRLAGLYRRATALRRAIDSQTQQMHSGGSPDAAPLAGSGGMRP